MSFNYDTKYELCSVAPKQDCCKLAQLYGMVLFSQQLGVNHIKMTTENVLIVNMMNELTNDVCHLYLNVDETMSMYSLSVSGPRCKRLYESLYIDVNGKLDLSISGVITEKNCCKEAFLRGAFLVGGYASDPGGKYHFEISTPYFTLARSLRDFMQRMGFPARSVLRKSNYIVYMKDSEQIERFLYLVGARSSSFQIADAKIQKEVSNNANRIRNTEMHNLDRVIDSSVQQIKAINKIERVIGLGAIDEELAYAARLRLDNPDKSLTGLTELSDRRWSRSGLGRRLKKLSDLADALGEK